MWADKMPIAREKAFIEYINCTYFILDKGMVMVNQKECQDTYKKIFNDP